MNLVLPRDLSEAEEIANKSIIAFNVATKLNRFSVKFKFEGLRPMPIVIRLAKTLDDNNINNMLAWSDAGATALAKRDAPDLNSRIFSFSEIIKVKDFSSYPQLLIAVAPKPYDYEDFEALCKNYPGKILMFNGQLDDPVVGIGSVARERRKGFISSWTNIFWLEALQGSALMHNYPDKWKLFRHDSDGYRFLKSFEQQPNSEEIFEVTQVDSN